MSVSTTLTHADLPKLGVKTTAAATLFAIAATVALPQAVHIIGAASGMGDALGMAFLPMHLPIIFVGLIAGPVAGAISGALAPLASFALTGMPVASMLPLMVVELCVYGLVAGLLRGVRLPSLAKVVVAQVAGRVAYTIAVAIAVAAFGSGMDVASIWTGDLAAGLPGIVLQLALLPPLAYWVDSLVARRG